MDSIVTLVLILAGVMFLAWFSGKLRDHMQKAETPFMTQLKFLRLYLLDKTELEFYDKSHDEVVEYGQDVLWNAANHLRNTLKDAVENQTPMEPDDIRMLTYMIRIIKAAEMLVRAERGETINAPIVDMNIES